MRSDKYWARRAIELEKLMQDKTDATIVQVNKLYTNALLDIDKQIAKTFENYLAGGQLSRQEALQLLSHRDTKEAREALLKQLSQATDPKLKQELINKLNAPAYAYRISRLEALKDSVYFQARMIGLKEVRMVTDRLRDVLEQSYYKQTFNIQKGVGYGFRPELLTDNRIKAMLAHDWMKGGNYSERIWGNNKEFASKVQDIIERGVLSGQSGKVMRDSLIAAAGMDNTKGARYVSNRLIRTEVCYFAAQGQILSYGECGIRKYQFIATLDLVTSQVCRELDLKTFPVEEAKAGKNLPPMHPHCRSTTSPYAEERDYSKLQRRARDPETGKTYLVPANMSYQEWYKKYVTPEKEAAFQQKRLAKTQGYDKIEITTANGLQVKGASHHMLERAKERNVPISAVKDALTKPLHICDTVRDESGKNSQRFIGNAATVNLNPDTGNIITVWKTGKATVKKYTKKEE